MLNISNSHPEPKCLKNHCFASVFHALLFSLVNLSNHLTEVLERWQCGVQVL